MDANEIADKVAEHHNNSVMRDFVYLYAKAIMKSGFEIIPKPSTPENVKFVWAEEEWDDTPSKAVCPHCKLGPSSHREIEEADGMLRYECRPKNRATPCVVCKFAGHACKCGARVPHGTLLCEKCVVHKPVNWSIVSQSDNSVFIFAMCACGEDNCSWSDWSHRSRWNNSMNREMG